MDRQKKECVLAMRWFPKENHQIIDVPAKLKDTFLGNADEDELQEVLKCTIYLPEEMLS